MKFAGIDFNQTGSRLVQLPSRLLVEEDGNGEGAGSGGAVAGAVIVIGGLTAAAGTIQTAVTAAADRASDAIGKGK